MGCAWKAIAADIAGDGDTALLTAADRLDDKASGCELGYRIDPGPDAGGGRG